jgi:hypothetical protein
MQDGTTKNAEQKKGSRRLSRRSVPPSKADELFNMTGHENTYAEAEVVTTSGEELDFPQAVG